MKAIVIGIGLVGAAVIATAFAQPRPNEVGEFMRMKLVHSQKVLEGLALEDFNLVRKHGQELSLLSQATNWQVLQTPEYLQHSEEFRRAVDAMVDAAKDRNLDGAALAYMESTLKCINCHKYVRDVRMAAIDWPATIDSLAER